MRLRRPATVDQSKPRQFWRKRVRMPNGMLCVVYPVKQNRLMRKHVGRQFAQSIRTKPRKSK